MLLTVLEFVWWLQGAPTPGPTGGGGGGGAGGMDGCALQAGMLLVMMVIFYFLLLRPEQKRRREHEEMMKSLTKGTKVRTTGGILGEVVSVTEDEVILQVADRVRINVLRSHVATVESARLAAKAAEVQKKDDKKKSDDGAAEASDKKERQDEA